MVIGDSLSAEYGIKRDTGWVALLDERLAQRGLGWRVVNASVSGETTSGGLTRLPALLGQHRPAVVILELGANDGLRGLPIATMKRNLAAMIELARAQGARVLLVGMRIPPNYGRPYAVAFADAFAHLAAATGIGAAPFLLDGIADRPEMFQADRIHPLEAAQPRLLDNVWPALQPMLAKVPRKTPR